MWIAFVYKKNTKMKEKHFAFPVLKWPPQQKKLKRCLVCLRGFLGEGEICQAQWMEKWRSVCQICITNSLLPLDKSIHYCMIMVKVKWHTEMCQFHEKTAFKMLKNLLTLNSKWVRPFASYEGIYPKHSGIYLAAICSKVNQLQTWSPIKT